MKKWMWICVSFVTAFLGLLFVFGGVAPTAVFAQTSQTDETNLERALDKMPPELAQTILEAEPGSHIPVLIRVSGTADLGAAPLFNDQTARTEFVVAQLQQTAVSQQQAVRAFLDTAQQNGEVSQYRAYFIFNGLAVSATPSLLVELAARGDVTAVYPDSQLQLFNSQQITVNSQQSTANSQQSPISQSSLSLDATHAPINRQSSIEWNISKINADDVWTEFGLDGEGVLVANIDTGVQWNHPALVNQYAGSLPNGQVDHDFHWYDNTTSGATIEPYDDHGHGTHTMGTTVGGDGNGPFANDIGVAPGARWIAVRIFDASGFTQVSQMLDAFEWIVAPCPAGVIPGAPSCDPARAPKIVNNSWGSTDGTDLALREPLANVAAAGIWMEFSAGNSGPGNFTVASPASFPEIFATGATDINDVIADFSSRGPSQLTDEIKPEVVAPGVDVLSAVPGDSYAEFSGTSMAGPHTVGVAALMLQAAPDLDFETMERLIRETAVDLGEPGPDFIYGYGRIDAYKAVERLLDAASLSGTVLDSDTNQPVANASVHLEGDELTSQVTTGADGTYAMNYLLSGTYTLTVSAFGYETAVIPNLVIPTDSDVVQEINLTPLPFYTISGFVRHAITPTIPISNAIVTVRDTPLPSVAVDADGFYSLDVPEGEAVIEAAAFGFETAVTATTLISDTTINFSLNPLPPILLVDDDEGRSRIYSPHVEATYLAALDANGYSYDYWDIEAQGPPSFELVRQYAAVVWFSGEWGRIKDISDGSQAQMLMDYLDSGGRLFYISQSHTFYHSEDKVCDTPQWGGEGPCPFTEHYLGIADWVEDQKSKVAYGVPGNPVGDGLGPYILDFPTFVSDLTDDITPTLQASLAFTVTDTVPPDDVNRIATTVFSPTSGFKTVYLAAPLGAFPLTAQPDVMKAVLDWFGINGQTAGVSISPAIQSESVPAGEPISYTVRLRNLSPFSDSFTLSIEAAPWPTTIWNHEMTAQINQIGPLAAQETADFIILVDVPETATPGDVETAVIQATSQSGTPHQDSVLVETNVRMVYRVNDSDSCGVTYDWIDALEGDPIKLDDADSSVPTFVQLELPEPFTFYNNAYDHLYVNDHATILFGDDNYYTDRFPSGVPPIPNPTLLDPNNAIYLNWDVSFWHPSDEPEDAGVYTAHVMENGRNLFVITYHNYGNFISDTFDDFQVILDLDSYAITMQYKDVGHVAPSTIGIENFAGTEGVLYVDDEEPAENILHDELAIRYSVTPPLLRSELDLETAVDQKIINTEGVAIYEVTLQNRGNITDSYTLDVSGNDWPVTFIDPVTDQPIMEIEDVAPCTAVDFLVRVEHEGTGVMDQAIVQARSQRDALQLATVTLTTQNHPFLYFIPVLGKE